MAETNIIRITTAGVARSKAGLTKAQIDTQRAILEEMYGPLRKEVTRIFAQHALGGARGRIGRNISAVPHREFKRPGIIVTSTYRTPEGYDPLPVTRFGHRRNFIVPRTDRAPAFSVRTRAKREVGRRAALRAVDRRDGQVFFRYRLKAYKVSGDWVTEARAAAQPAIDASADRIGRKIVSSIRNA